MLSAPRAREWKIARENPRSRGTLSRRDLSPSSISRARRQSKFYSGGAAAASPSPTSYLPPIWPPPSSPECYYRAIRATIGTAPGHGMHARLGGLAHARDPGATCRAPRKMAGGITDSAPGALQDRRNSSGPTAASRRRTSCYARRKLPGRCNSRLRAGVNKYRALLAAPSRLQLPPASRNAT